MSLVHLAASSVHGTGVFAREAIPRGHPVLRIDDSRVVDEAHPLQEGEHEYHRDWLANGTVVLMMPPERHINHCCDPNTFVRTINGVRWVFALRDIAAGEEITYDYCINSGGDTVWTCTCGSARCRHTIHSDFFHLPMTLQLEYLPLLDEWFMLERRDEVEKLLQVAMGED
jgi:hypothetical protein